MIQRVRLKNFKRFREQDFRVEDLIVLAGPNNSGKSTLLQALSVWNLALNRWRTAPKGKSPKRGLPITRKDFTAVPLREMSMLWTDSSTALRRGEADGEPGHPRLMEIEVSGSDARGPWNLAFEFRFQGEEQIYVKPRLEHVADLERVATGLGVVHIPPFSGIGVDEPRVERAYQDYLVGQGKPGDILRNLLYEVFSSERGAWDQLVHSVDELFRCELIPPQAEGRPFIICEYQAIDVDAKRKPPPLDISSGGSGFHQVLLLLAFFFARPSTVLLLDEPDAHLHVILQKQIYDLLRRVASQRNCQLIIATHSEILIDSTSPASILSFLSTPHVLVEDTERDQVREALRRLTTIDLLLAEQSGGVLYLEGVTDFNLLKAWAQVLAHPTASWFNEKPFWHSNQGRHPREARGHFFALRSIRPGIKGLLLLDGDNRNLPNREVAADGLDLYRWTRYEIENYLIHPEALRRFVAERRGPLFAEAPMRYLEDELPPAVLREPLGDHPLLQSIPASKTLIPEFFRAAGMQLRKEEYDLLAREMLPSEIPGEILTLLDQLEAILGIEAPPRQASDNS